MTTDLADADPVAVVYAWLRQHPKVLAALGAPEHLSGIREAPWPHLVVGLGAGGAPDDHELLISEPEVELVVWGHPDGSHSDPALRRLLMTAVAAVVELRTAPYDPVRPVVSRVRATTPPQPQTLVNGQRRWRQGVTLRLRPPQDP